jgi:hypothetical protein
MHTATGAAFDFDDLVPDQRDDHVPCHIVTARATGGNGVAGFAWRHDGVSCISLCEYIPAGSVRQ